MRDYEVNFRGKGIMVSLNNGIMGLNDYDDDLSCVRGGEWDIVEVRRADFNCVLNFDGAQVIWKREEPKTLTQKEHDFVSMFDFEKWISRDISGNLIMYQNKPSKEELEWSAPYGHEISLVESAFKFIKWTDEEPYSTKEMLKWEIEG